MRSDLARKEHWAPTHFHFGEESDFAGMRIDWLIDNREAYDAIVGAVRDARVSIWVSQLAFDADCRAYASDDPGSDADTGENLIDVILATSIGQRVKVKILVNSTLLLDTKRPLARFLAEQKIAPGLVEVRGMSRFPQLLHAKMVIVDERRAFIVGSPFVNGYWDTPAHSAIDNRRPHRELAGRPVHDVSIGLSGPIVHELAGIVARYWHDAERGESDRGAPVRQTAIAHSRAGIAATVVTTEPAGARGSRDFGSLETREALLEGIGRARSLIYIEHQYLSSRAIVDALRRALTRVPELEVILLLNQNPDVTAYRRWQNSRLAEARLLGHPRVGVFGLWSAQKQSGLAPAINQVFLHSKVVIVDDEWAMVGSANLDGASLDSYGDEFSGRLARRVFRDVRNFDVNIVLTARKSSQAHNPIRQLRERLWIEHLGHSSTEQMEWAHGRVAEWHALASRNVAALNMGTDGSERGLEGTFIMPYSTSPSPRAQLADGGVRTTDRVDLRFNPGWLEMNFSPNWIRNMFL
ncbi:MAG: phospholipase D-like domain-containing protein [Gemmatimonadota bacterium]|nr:phospholipase D-like domain-containing protein [Gemmatimonadota bacterium]